MGLSLLGGCCVIFLRMLGTCCIFPGRDLLDFERLHIRGEVSRRQLLPQEVARAVLGLKSSNLRPQRGVSTLRTALIHPHRFFSVRRNACGIGVGVPPWRQPRGKWMVSLVNSHTNATRIGWHLWEIDLRFAPGLLPGSTCMPLPRGHAHVLRCWFRI